jgi:large subunit ribosomal protein L27
MNVPGPAIFGGQSVHTGEVLVRQTGSTKIAGPGTFISRDYTIHAAIDGVVNFNKVRKSRFTGKTAPRTQVSVQ